MLLRRFCRSVAIRLENIVFTSVRQFGQRNRWKCLWPQLWQVVCLDCMTDLIYQGFTNFPVLKSREPYLALLSRNRAFSE